MEFDMLRLYVTLIRVDAHRVMIEQLEWSIVLPLWLPRDHLDAHKVSDAAVLSIDEHGISGTQMVFLGHILVADDDVWTIIPGLGNGRWLEGVHGIWMMCIRTAIMTDDSRNRTLAQHL